MLRRLRSLQEQCRSKPSLPERPFYNIGRTPEQPTPVANDCENSLQQNSVDFRPHVSTPKPNSNTLSSNCADVVGGQDECDLPSMTEKSAKRLHSDIESVGAVDSAASPTLLSPARKRCRQDTGESLDAVDADIAATGKSPAVISSPVEKSVDSTNVELSLSAVGEPCNASSASTAAFVLGQSGSCSQLNSLSRPASAVRSPNCSPRTLSSRRDLGRVVFSLMCCEYML